MRQDKEFRVPDTGATAPNGGSKDIPSPLQIEFRTALGAARDIIATKPVFRDAHTSLGMVVQPRELQHTFLTLLDRPELTNISLHERITDEGARVLEGRININPTIPSERAAVMLRYIPASEKRANGFEIDVVTQAENDAFLLRTAIDFGDDPEDQGDITRIAMMHALLTQGEELPDEVFTVVNPKELRDLDERDFDSGAFGNYLDVVADPDFNWDTLTNSNETGKAVINSAVRPARAIRYLFEHLDQPFDLRVRERGRRGAAANTVALTSDGRVMMGGQQSNDILWLTNLLMTGALTSSGSH